MKICNNGITRDMTTAEIAAWQRSIVGLAATATDAELAAAQVAVTRTAKIAAIQSHTLALKENGVEWPANSGVMHSLTDDRIAVYNGAQIRKGVLSYPRKFIGKSGKIVSAANQTAHNDFDATLMARYIALEDIGIQLIEACHAATTTAELEAIVDDRT